jgi:hypothetical protein
MALTFTRQSIDGGDLDAWGSYEQAQNHLSLGLNTSRLYVSGTTLYLRKGVIGFYDGSTYGVITNDADATLSVAGLTVSTWARVEIAVVAGVPVITLTSVAASGTDLGALITMLVGAYDASKGGFYVSATKRCLGVVKINAAGNPIWAVNVDNALWRFGQEIGAAELTVSLPTAVTFQAGILNLELEFVKLDSAAGEWELDASGAETFFYPGGTSGGLWVGQQYARVRIRPVPGGFLFAGGNLQVMALGSNTALGIGALKSNISGTNNTAVGWSALTGNLTGIDNTAFGSMALMTHTGYACVAVGAHALKLNTTGDRNVAVGVNALGTNTTGAKCVAIGTDALIANNADYNVSVGCYSMLENTSGTNNVAVGYAALHLNTTGYSNTAIGMQSLYFTITGSRNTGVGASVLQANIDGTDNTAVGYEVLKSNTTGIANTALGRRALNGNLVGSYNTGIGQYSGYSSIAERNVFIGSYSGYYETGSDKLFVDDRQRASEADARAKALIYGVFDDAIANQSVQINAKFGCNGTTPQAPVASGGALNAYAAGANGLSAGADMQALHALVVAMRAALVADGIMS